MSNYYSILGIEKNASRSDIKSAYNKLVKIYYPDKNTGNAEKFEQIVEAYKVLTNTILKSDYDKEIDTVSDFMMLKTNFEKDIKIIDCSFLGTLESSTVEPINNDEFKNRLQDYKLIREQEDIEHTQVNMFEDTTFDNDTFNQTFEKNNPSKNIIIKFEDLGSAYDFGSQHDISKDDANELDNLFFLNR